MSYMSDGLKSATLTVYKRNMYERINFEFSECCWYCDYLVRSLVLIICSSESSEGAHVRCLRDSRSIYSTNKFITQTQNSFQEFMQIYLFFFSFLVWSSKCLLPVVLQYPLEKAASIFQRSTGLCYTFHGWEIF